MEHLLSEITPWVIKYGLLVVFVGMIVEGTMMILITGFLCYLGMLPLKESILVAILGAVTGDQMWYLLGRYASDTLLQRFDKLKAGIEKLSQKVIQKGDYLAFSSRFVYSGAVLFPMTLGMSRYPYSRFTLLDSIGISIWAIVGISIGYMFSASAEKMFGEIKTIEHLLLYIIAIVAMVSVYRRYKKTK